MQRKPLTTSYFNQTTIGNNNITGGAIIGTSMLGGIYSNSMGIMGTPQNSQDLNNLSGLRFNNTQFGIVGNNWQGSIEIEDLGPSKRLQEKPISQGYFFPNKR